jgi:hypothetical protein
MVQEHPIFDLIMKSTVDMRRGNKGGTKRASK